MTHRVASILATILMAVTLTACATGQTVTYVDDSTTTASVRSKLMADRPASLSSVGVETVNGVVYLTGIVATPEQRLRAEQLAWEANGTRQIVNNIQVQRPAATVVVPSAAVAVPLPTAVKRSVIGTVSSVDPSRSQVTVSTGAEQLLLQLPVGMVRDLRPGDQVTVDVTARPMR